MRIVWVGALFAAATLVACSKDRSREASSGASDSAVVATSEATAPIVVRAAGLRFDPPSTWPRQRYLVDVTSGDDASAEQPGAAHAVSIVYQPDQPGHREASLCRILVFGRGEWTRIEMEAGPPVGTMIEKLDAWVYVAQLPQSNPYPNESLDGGQFDAMRLSIREVRARFQIEGDGPVPPGAGEL